MNRRYTAVYLGWIALCVLVYFAVSGAGDPSRRRDRILTNDAGARALEILRRTDRAYQGYEVVHIAYASRGETGTEARWIVLLDSNPHSELRKAVVVELRASDGALMKIRRPVS